MTEDLAHHVVGRFLPRLMIWTGVAAIVVTTLLCGSSCFAGDPPPDPAGLATGDKTSVVDAGGNALVVPEPTDPAAPPQAILALHE